MFLRLLPIPQGMTPNTQKRLLSLMLSLQIILIGINLVFSVMTLVITVLQPVFVMAVHWNDLSWFVIDFKEQAFLHELASVKWYRISLIPSVEDARTYGIVTKHTPINKMRIKNRFSPWFDRDLAELLHHKNCIWRNIHILRLTGSRSGKWEIRALRVSGRPKLVTLRGSSLTISSGNG